MKKRLLICLLALAAASALCFLPAVYPEAGPGQSVLREAECGFSLLGEAPAHSARCMALIDADSGRLIYAENENERRGMASTTKIMTALIVIENCPAGETVRVPADACGIEGSSVYLREGETLTVEELLYCMLLESGNDAAAALALHCAGSTEAFAAMMNERAAELGLKNTHFSNPHGLSARDHYTSAYDLAIITRAAYGYPLFERIAGAKRKSVPLYGVPDGRSLVNHNRLLFSYEGAAGVKTGYTVSDGKCLVSAAEREGLQLICVTLYDGAPWETHRALLDSAFANYRRTEVARERGIIADIPLSGGENAFVTAANPAAEYVTLPDGAGFYLDLDAPESLCAPVEKGEIIARARVLCGGETVYVINLEALQSEPARRKSLWEIIKEKLFGKE